MNATRQSSLTAFLHRGGMIAAVLAVIAGIFGMHVMTGTSSMHPPDTATAAPAGLVHAGPADGQAGHSAAAAPSVSLPSAATHTTRTSLAQYPDPCSCPGMQTMPPGCIPSAAGGSLAAPMPRTIVHAVNTNDGALLAGTVRWFYLPVSPSPGELCISRT
ncbi:hypothetical protein [Arthrobacter sp. UYEF3]|uniref:hypothetical protein n=1 Tax=Arthrobacter sp. UYEF3 TaxID=1756365 RepID=UPI0033938DE2